MDDDDVELEELGYAIVAGTRMPILGVHFCQGAIGVRCLIPKDFKGCVDGLVTLFGHDERGIMQLPETITIPAVPENVAYGVMELQLAGGG